MTRGHHTLAALCAALLLVSCAGSTEPSASRTGQRLTTDPRPQLTRDTPTEAPERRQGPRRAAPRTDRTPQPMRPEPRRSYLAIPAIGVHDVALVRYRGSPDDAEGTRIQNAGPAASPRGPRGGVGPGDVGNHIVTGHRTSHAAPFADLPAVRAGTEVRVRTGNQVYLYRVTRTRWTSFRSAASLRAQSAPVPGKPGREAVRPMITLSTCATPEDHANGNYWSDRFGNPEHRIDKIGVLVDVRRARSTG